MQDSKGSRSPTKRRVLNNLPVVHKNGFGINYIVTDRLAFYNNIWCDDVVAEDNFQARIFLCQSSDLCKMTVLFKLMNLSTCQEIPFTGTEVAEMGESILQKIASRFLKTPTSSLSFNGGGRRFHSDSIENSFCQANTGRTTFVCVVGLAILIDAKHAVKEDSVVMIAQALELGNIHCRTNPITYSSCIRCSIWELFRPLQRAGIIRRSRSSRRDPIPATEKPTLSPTAARPLCVSTSTPRKIEVPTTTTQARPCASTLRCSAKTDRISEK